MFGSSKVQKSKVINRNSTLQPLSTDFLFFHKKDRLKQLLEGKLQSFKTVSNDLQP